MLNSTVYRYSDSWRSGRLCMSANTPAHVTDLPRLHRRTFHQRFQPRIVPEYYGIQMASASLLMERLAASPEKFDEHVRCHAGSIILQIIYGYSIQPVNDPYLRLVHNALEGTLKAINHGSFWVDYLPSLKYVPAWFPGAGFKRDAKRWRHFQEQLKEQPWQWVKGALQDGNAGPSFCTKTIERLSVTPGEDSAMEDVIKNCAAMSYAAGADTTVSALMSFILAMVLYPDVQERARREIEAVTGSTRLPDFDDHDDLPFVNALIAETLRWNPVTPLAVPHRALQDDIYEGYYIPAGSTIVANAWAILHDESLYGPNPMEFNPDRFMKQEDGNPPNPERFAFGFGRRQGSISLLRPPRYECFSHMQEMPWKIPGAQYDIPDHHIPPHDIYHLQSDRR
ncbi:hypothetical protein PM082_000144 [Marasmius tenuissimus]|nr:hypothetical protein PM082_000144 [Marasmius tenuissimus]